MPPLNDLAGQRFGRLIVIGRAPNRGKHVAWECKCNCGNMTTVMACNLTREHTQSCGCLAQDNAIKANTTHGMTHTPEYYTWWNMIARCHCPSASSYSRYGAIGIKVCQRWRESFKAFYEDMGPRPTPKHSIDRIDNTKNYTPENTRWSTAKQQARNKRNNRLVTLDGETHTIAEWSEIVGIARDTIAARIDNYGWSTQDALHIPTRLEMQPRLEFNGESHTLAEWARIINMPYGTISNRIKRGWSIERALTEPLHKKR